MIKLTLEFLAAQVNEYLNHTLDPKPTTSKIVLSNVVDNDMDDAEKIPSDSILLSLIHLEEERHAKAQEPYARRGDRNFHAKPDIRLNLYILFSANYTYTNYPEGLKIISAIIAYFQRQNVFDPSKFPNMDPMLKRLVVDLYTMPMDQQSQMWQALGGRFLPSVMYKIRLVPIFERAAQYEVPLIEEVDTN